MRNLESFKKNKFLIWTLIFAFLNMATMFLVFGFPVQSDTVRYIKAAQWFRGGMQGIIDPEAIIRPLGPIIAAPFEFLGEGAGLVIQNIIFYIFSAFLIFRIAELVFGDKRKAFFASLFFITATPLLEFGLAFLTDMGAWFFYLFSLYLTLLYFRNRNEKLIMINGFLSGIGFLMKENGSLGALFFGLMILFSKDFNIKDKFLKIINFGTFFLIPIGALQLLTYKYFRYTSWDWYLKGGLPGTNNEGFLMTNFRYLGQLFRVMGILWPLVLLGTWKEWKEKNQERLKIFLALLPPSFSFFLWNTSAGARTVFIFAPLGILLAIKSFDVFEKKLDERIKTPAVMLLVLILIALNYSFVWLNPRIAFADILAKFLGLL